MVNSCLGCSSCQKNMKKYLLHYFLTNSTRNNSNYSLCCFMHRNVVKAIRNIASVCSRLKFNFLIFFLKHGKSTSIDYFYFFLPGSGLLSVIGFIWKVKELYVCITCRCTYFRHNQSFVFSCGLQVTDTIRCHSCSWQ